MYKYYPFARVVRRSRSVLRTMSTYFLSARLSSSLSSVSLRGEVSELNPAASEFSRGIAAPAERWYISCCRVEGTWVLACSPSPSRLRWDSEPSSSEFTTLSSLSSRVMSTVRCYRQGPKRGSLCPPSGPVLLSTRACTVPHEGLQGARNRCPWSRCFHCKVKTKKPGKDGLPRSIHDVTNKSTPPSEATVAPGRLPETTLHCGCQDSPLNPGSGRPRHSRRAGTEYTRHRA